MSADVVIKGNRRSGLAGATLGFFIGFAAVSLFGATGTYLKGVIGLDPIMVGLLISIPNLTGSLLRIPFAAWVDKDGGRRPFMVLLALSVIGMLGITVVMNSSPEVIGRSLPIILVFGGLAGCGIATFSVGIGQTSYWFPQKEQGKALGTYAGVGNLAPGIFALLLSLVTIRLVGIGGSYVIWFVLLLIGTIAYGFLGRNAWYFQYRKAGLSHVDAVSRAEKDGQELFPKGKVSESLGVSASNVQTWLLVMIYFTTFGGFLAFTGWLTKYNQEFFGLSLGLAGAITAFYSIGASLLRIAGGSISDRFGGKRTALISLVIAMAGSVMLALSSNLAFSVAALVFLAFGMGVGNAAVFKMVPQAVPEAVGGAAGWVGGLGALGGFVIPMLLSLFLTAGLENDPGYARGFWIFTILFGVSILITAVIKRKNS